MSSLADVRAMVRVLLQDEDDTNYVWPTSVLDQFINEGARRLHPLCFNRVNFLVDPDGTETTFTLDTELSESVIEVEAVVSDLEDLEGTWEVYNGVLMFESAPQEDFYVRAAVKMTAIDDVPDELIDAVVYYAAGRCLQFLSRRGGSALRRYLSEQGELEQRELDALTQGYLTDFAQIRQENALSTTRRL